jgi:pyruvate kinase
VVVFTASGSSARLVSRYRPPVPIYAFTPSDAVARQLAINFGITPILSPDAGSFDEMIAQMDRCLVEMGYVKVGDAVVFVAGQPIGRAGSTNLIKLHRVGMG